MQNIKYKHEVIFLIKQNNNQWTPEELNDTIGNNWEIDVQFGSCSGNAFPKENALHFLINRQKAVLSDSGKVSVHPTMQICNAHKEF